jgi:hypothetical protein
LKSILAQGDRWELTGEANNNPTMVLTILDQGKSFPPFRQLIAQGIAENILDVINGRSSTPIESSSDLFEVTKHRLGICLRVKPERDGQCNEVVLSCDEGRDMAKNIFRVIR